MVGSGCHTKLRPAPFVNETPQRYVNRITGHEVRITELKLHLVFLDPHSKTPTNSKLPITMVGSRDFAGIYAKSSDWLSPSFDLLIEFNYESYFWSDPTMINRSAPSGLVSPEGSEPTWASMA